MKAVLVLGCAVVALALVGWLGLRLRPRPFQPFSQRTPPLKRVPLPEGLPAPVERFYRGIYGDSVPVIDSAVISGRARLRVNGITFPGRFRFIHVAGKDYRHYIEATFYGLPVMKVNELYLDGNSRLELPFGVTEGDPKVNEAANLGLWAESVWFPSILITDERVRWEPVDEGTALLIVPFEDRKECFVARFSSETGMLHILESMRYKDGASERKTLWLNEVLEWSPVNGSAIATAVAVTWFDEGTPWAKFWVEDVAYNVDVQDYVRAKGP